MERSAAVLEVISEAYVAVTADGRVLEWNPAAETTFGWTRQQAVGADIAELILTGRHRAAYLNILRRAAAGRLGHLLERRLQFTAVHRDGYELPVETTLTVSGQVVHALAHDMSAALRGSRFTTVEAAVLRGLAEAPTSDNAAVRVCEALSERMGWPVAELWLHDSGRAVLACIARHNRADRDLTGFVLPETAIDAGLPGLVYQEGRAHWVPDLAADLSSSRGEAAARIGLRVAVGVPIRSGDQVLGALCVFGDRAEKSDPTLIGLLGVLAAHIGQFLERRRAEELAVDLARTKDEFLTLVTHELRNPLAVILGTVALLGDDVDPADREQHMRIIESSAQRLSVMTDDLLDLARLESGSLDISPTDLDLAGLLHDSIASARIAADVKDITIQADLPARLPVCGDPGRLRQVADNLLANAVKYTPPGGTVTVTAAPDSGRPGWVTWSVADTGIGIPPADRPRLFRRFYRASTAVTAKIPGTGLGLVVTRTIIERHHGTITVADAPGPGTTFLVRLPRDQPVR